VVGCPILRAWRAFYPNVLRVTDCSPVCMAVALDVCVYGAVALDVCVYGAVALNVCVYVNVESIFFSRKRTGFTGVVDLHSVHGVHFTLTFYE
jgi:hypothetical protein